MTITQKRVLKVLERITKMVEEDDKYAKIFSREIQDMLSMLSDNDHFEIDPRGDGDIGYWAMDHVQGVDEEIIEH